jgi:cation:H+ antiporter
MTYLITIVGFALLLAGGEGLVRGAVGIARHLKISPFIVGLTIVGFGTSAPEIVISVDAALSGAPGIAVGNVVGSNMANILMIIGIAALLQPLAIHRDALRRDSTAMIVATLLFMAVAHSGTATALHSVGMLAALFLYLAYSLWSDSRNGTPAAVLHGAEAEEITVRFADRLPVLATICVVGLVVLVGGARMVVYGATAIARDFGMSEELIGITLIAVGTSLPELATALIAARRGHADVCVGNVLGSNIFNLLGITGAAALAAPLPFTDEIVNFDIWALLAATLLFVGFMASGSKVNRIEGGILLILYGVYIAYHFV